MVAPDPLPQSFPVFSGVGKMRDGKNVTLNQFATCF